MSTGCSPGGVLAAYHRAGRARVKLYDPAPRAADRGGVDGEASDKVARHFVGDRIGSHVDSADDLTPGPVRWPGSTASGVWLQAGARHR